MDHTSEVYTPLERASSVVSRLKCRNPKVINQDIEEDLMQLIESEVQEAMEQALGSVNFQIGDRVSVAHPEYADRVGRIVGIQLVPSYNGEFERARYTVSFLMCGGYVEPTTIHCTVDDLAPKHED